MCLTSVTDLTANMVEPRVLTPAERLEALLMASLIDGRAEACNKACERIDVALSGRAQENARREALALRDLLTRNAALLRKLAT